MVDFDAVRSALSAADDTVSDCLDDGWTLPADIREADTSSSASSAAMDVRREEVRLQTFRHWPSDWAALLARFGFISVSGDCEGSVQCVFCGRTVRGFSSPQEAHLRHWQLARHCCRYLQGQDVGNVPLPLDSRPCSLTSDPRPLTRAGEQAALLPAQAGVSGEDERQQQQQQQQSVRLTFTEPNPGTTSSRSCLTTRPPTPSKQQSLVTCSGPGQREEKEKDEAGGSKDRLTRTVHWTEMVRTARYPSMASIQARLKTLSRWPLLRPSRTELAKAGFFHVRCASAQGPESGGASSSGRPRDPGECGDAVKCFWCGEGIHCWQKTDDAVVEHARLSPACLFVSQLLGSELRDDIVHNVTEAAAAGVGAGGGARHQQTWGEWEGVMMYDQLLPERSYITESHPTYERQYPASTTTATAAAVATHHQDHLHHPHHHHHQHHQHHHSPGARLSPSQLDDLMQSPPVRTVLQMGFPPQLIRRLLSHNSERLSADTLCHLALQAAEKTSRASPATSPAEGLGEVRSEYLEFLKAPEERGDSETLGSTVRRVQNEGPGSVLQPTGGEAGEAGRGRLMCKVCSEAEVKVIFRPCNHVVCCSRCIALFTSCPMCHQIIENVLTVHIT